jgi:hypothetical protein
MILKNDLKIFILTAFISTVVFFVFGNIIFKGLLSYGDWTLVLFPAHIILTFIIMTPLLIVFWYIEKEKRITSVIYRVGLRTIIGTLYIATLLWFSIFSDTKQRLKDPFNYYEDLKYLGLYTLITILTFAITDYYYETKKAK